MSQRKIFVYTSFVFVLIFTFTFQVFAQASMAYMTEPAMSPDNKEIAFVSGGDIWTVPSVGGNRSNPCFASRD